MSESSPGRHRSLSAPAVMNPEDSKRQQAASKIQSTFKNFMFRKRLAKARPDIQAVMKGETPDRIMDLMGESYKEAGLVRDTVSPISKASGRLAGDWSGGVATQKKHLNDQPGREAIGTVHHTISDHFLGFVNEGVKRLEAGTTEEQQAGKRFRDEVNKGTLYTGANPEKALFQLRQNLTYGPLTETISGDPGQGFDPTFKELPKPHSKTGVVRDWEERSTAIRPVHNMGLLMKSGKFELTPAGADHMTKRMDSAKTHHDTSLAGQTYDVSTKRLAKGGVEVTETTSHPVTIPHHSKATGHFEAEKGTAKVRKVGFTGPK